MRRIGFVLIMTFASPALSQELRFEAENCSEPASAWLKDRHADDHWNLWSTDKDAQAKWSGGVVLQSPVVKADRATPEEGAPPLHTRIAGLSNGVYDVSLRVGRTLGFSLDGRTWRPYRGGLLCDALAVTNGVIEFWVDDRYATTGNVGAAYYDYVTLAPLPAPVAKPKVEGHAAARVAEKLDRGLVAVPAAAGTGAYAGWRLLRADPPGVGFNLYRQTGGGAPERLNAEPITQTTDWTDAGAPRDADLVYTLRAVRDGREGDVEGSAAVRLAGDARTYLALKLDGAPSFDHCGVADLDGDGRYDFVIKQPRESIDPYSSYWKPSPGTYKLEAYRSDGRLLWRKDLGWSIEMGIWYSPYLVYDLDGDGKAEVVAKTGEGDPRGPDGRVRSGPEWVTVWDGATGRERARVPWPDRSEFGEGESGYNYASRNQLAVAYLDGKTPCLVVLRGTYTVMKADAYELVGDTLRPLWTFRDAEGGRRYRGQGCHFTHAVDVDGDGRDEVILGSSAIDDNGTPLWSTGLGHPDCTYIGDIDPVRPGLEMYCNLEPPQPRNGLCLVDPANGKILWGWDKPTKHVHSFGLCADIDPTHPGCEAYGADSVDHKPTGDRWLWAADGTLISRDVDLGFGQRCAYWDADLQRELIAGDRLQDFGGRPLPGRVSRNVVLVADVFGDWREELIASEGGELRIYTTTIPAMDRRATLMQDPIYRLDVAMGTMGYWLVPMTSYALDAVAPNLNLTVLPDRTNTVRVVVAAPRASGLAGTLRMSADGAECSPASLAIALAPGERRVEVVTVQPAAGGPAPARVAAVLLLESGARLCNSARLR